MIEDFEGGPGFMAFVVTFLLVVAVVLLIRSLNRHLRKVRSAPRQLPEEARSPLTDLEDGDGGGGIVADKPADG